MSVRSRALISSIIHTPISLPRLSALELPWPGNGPHQSAMRKFLRYRLPIIKYHNQHIKINIHRHGQPSVTVTRVDSSTESFPSNTPELRDADILNRIIAIDQQSAATIKH